MRCHYGGRKLTDLLCFEHQCSSALIYCASSGLKEPERLRELKFSPDPRAGESVLGQTKVLVPPGSWDLTFMVQGRGRPFCLRCPAMGLGLALGGGRGHASLTAPSWPQFRALLCTAPLSSSLNSAFLPAHETGSPGQAL